MIGARYAAMLGFLSSLLGGVANAQEVKAGALYSVEDGGGRYVIAKVLAVERGGVHVRLYKNTFASRPQKVEFKQLSLDGGGLGHLPVTHKQFRAWRPAYVGASPVTNDELEGYRMWQEAKGGFFGP